MVCFQTKNPKVGIHLLENVVLFDDDLEYFMAIWHNVWQFGIVCGHLVYYFPFWYVWSETNLATLPA
jgi:hypothetical protein